MHTSYTVIENKTTAIGRVLKTKETSSDVFLEKQEEMLGNNRNWQNEKKFELYMAWVAISFIINLYQYPPRQQEFIPQASFIFIVNDKAS